MHVFGYIQRTVKRLRLSKVKVAKYYDSGSLVVFYLVSLVWGINHIVKVSSLTLTCINYLQWVPLSYFVTRPMELAGRL